MKEEEGYKDGDYATLEEAVSKCKSIVDDFLEDEHKPGISPKELYDQYCMFGESIYPRSKRWLFRMGLCPAEAVMNYVSTRNDDNS